MKLLKFVVLWSCLLSISIFMYGCQEECEETDLCSTHITASKKYLLLYSEAISDYKKLVEFRLSPSFEDDYNSGRMPSLSKNWIEYTLAYSGVKSEKNGVQYRWNCMLADMLDYIDHPTKESFGYILADLNKDDIPELIWASMDYRIYCIFTIADNQVYLVESFWPRYACTIQNTGELLIREISGVSDYVYSLKEIDSTTETLVTRTKFGKEKGIYYIEEGTRTLLKEHEFEELCAVYPFTVSDKWKNNTIFHYMMDR